jgi:hypothetical protein
MTTVEPEREATTSGGPTTCTFWNGNRPTNTPGPCEVTVTTDIGDITYHPQDLPDYLDHWQTGLDAVRGYALRDAVLSEGYSIRY